MPATIKFGSVSSITPNRFNEWAKTNPVIAPMNREGIKEKEGIGPNKQMRKQ